MFILLPQWIAFWAPYVAPTISCGSKFWCLIMIFVENVLSWFYLFVFQLANLSHCWDHHASSVRKDSEKIFLIHILSTVLGFMRLFHNTFPQLFLFQHKNPEVIFFFWVQKSLHTFDHPVTLYPLFPLSSLRWDDWNHIQFKFKVMWAKDLYDSIIMFSSAVFSVLFLIFPNIPFPFLTAAEKLGDIFRKLFPNSLSKSWFCCVYKFLMVHVWDISYLAVKAKLNYKTVFCYKHNNY